MVLCDDLDGWDGGEAGGRLKPEGIYVYLQLIHIVVWQRPIQHYKAIVLQLKINLKRKFSNLRRKSPQFSLKH